MIDPRTKITELTGVIEQGLQDSIIKNMIVDILGIIDETDSFISSTHRVDEFHANELSTLKSIFGC